MDVAKVQALVDSKQNVTVQQLADAGIPANVELSTLGADTVIGQVVAVGRSSFSIVYVSVSQEQADLAKARIEWFRGRYPDSQAPGYFRPDGSLTIDQWVKIHDWLGWQEVPLTLEGLK